MFTLCEGESTDSELVTWIQDDLVGDEEEEEKGEKIGKGRRR